MDKRRLKFIIVFVSVAWLGLLGISGIIAGFLWLFRNHVIAGELTFYGILLTSMLAYAGQMEYSRRRNQERWMREHEETQKKWKEEMEQFRLGR